MSPPQHNSIYCAGIAVAAVKFGITVKKLSIGNEPQSRRYVQLEHLRRGNDDPNLEFIRSIEIEDYATALLSGSAALFIYEQEHLCQLKLLYGIAGLEMKYLRQLWAGELPEPDRASAIVCGLLGEYDDGDVEATIKRLWHRAIRILRQAPHAQRLKRLAKRLEIEPRMRGSDIQKLFQC